MLPDPSPSTIPSSAPSGPPLHGYAGALRQSGGSQDGEEGFETGQGSPPCGSRTDPTAGPAGNPEASLREAWQLAAEAYALQALALEAFASAPPRSESSSSSSSSHSTPALVASWAARGAATRTAAAKCRAGSVWEVFEEWAQNPNPNSKAGGRLPALLRRYIGGAGGGGASLLWRLRADADAAAADLLAQALLGADPKA